MTEQTYEEAVAESGEIKRDLEVVYGPTFKALKTAFGLIYQSAGYSGADFKRLSDMRYFQGGKPSPNSPPKEHTLAVQVANLMRLENSIERNMFKDFLKQFGVHIDLIEDVADDYTVSPDDEKKLLKAWEGAGIDASIPRTRSEALKVLIDKSQKIQDEIYDVQVALRDKAEIVEEDHKIKKSNFNKAVSLHAIKLIKGAGKAAEKADDAIENAENLIEALAPLK